MSNSTNIRLLGSSNNQRGDLFTRLTKDLFFTLGYDNLRLDVHKSGRELDLTGEHRFESRRVIGECKAQSEKYLWSLADVATYSFFKDKEQSLSEERAFYLRNSMKTGDRRDKVYTALISMNLAYGATWGKLNADNTALQEYF